MVDQVLAEAKMQRNLKGIRSYAEAFALLAENGHYIDMGQGWRAYFDEKVKLGFVMFSDKLAQKCPHGLYMCIVAGCDEMACLAHHCEHWPSVDQTPADSLFRTLTWDEADYLQLKALLIAKYKGIPYHTAEEINATQGCVLVKLAGKTLTFEEQNVQVGATGDSLQISIMGTDKILYSCGVNGCGKEGVLRKGDSYWCQDDYSKQKEWTKGDTAKYKKRALKMTRDKAMQIFGGKADDVHTAVNVLKLLRSRGDKGVLAKFPGGHVIFTRNKHGAVIYRTHKIETGKKTPRVHYVCIVCGGNAMEPKETCRPFCKEEGCQKIANHPKFVQLAVKNQLFVQD